MPSDTPTPASEADDPFCLAEGDAARLLAGHPWRRFVVLGDSVAEGLGEPTPGYPTQPWAERIGLELRLVEPGLRYYNLGWRNTPAAEVRAEQLPEALGFRPDLALVACGGFDALRSGFDAEAVTGELRAIVTALRDGGAEVITVGMFDGSLSPLVPEQYRAALRERLHSLSGRTAELAAREGALHFDLTAHPASARRDIYSSDGRHGSGRSHAIAAAEAVRRLGRRLGTG
ncbi:SGNH/GDSL hydrolase family protein [Kitasatospora sp. NBC_01287]|uniref:SGNH/GDSL hydrolase family protein n=1 Tax=Kitasatospora sp. NBC_01287 TaxID=2903573 RepID=UPI00225157BE|nr:SGNH/GDSL hydrolase family protein [Kitasatospora sp. NBC_01287]MCX4744833.1 SGNH/GDSL hydrolase family protein [Kitasatospora sp. NBC_01287]